MNSVFSYINLEGRARWYVIYGILCWWEQGISCRSFAYDCLAGGKAVGERGSEHRGVFRGEKKVAYRFKPAASPLK